MRAVSLNGSDRENLLGSPAYARWSNGLRRPRHPVPGSDVAGVVASVGSAVTEYAVGDELFGELAGYRGGLAELVCTGPKLLARKPSGLSFAEASTIPQAGGIARRATADVRPGDRVLVNGAGGVFVVALAKHAGAEVTAVDSADKGDFLREIGADRRIDFATEDWADERDSFDLIVDLVARRSPFRVHQALRRGRGGADLQPCDVGDANQASLDPSCPLLGVGTVGQAHQCRLVNEPIGHCHAESITLGSARSANRSAKARRSPTETGELSLAAPTGGVLTSGPGDGRCRGTRRRRHRRCRPQRTAAC